MGIVCNGFIWRSTGLKLLGATAINIGYPATHHGNDSQTGRRRNITAGQGITSGLVGLPEGERHPRAWMMPQKPGALASRNALTGIGSISATALAVKLAQASVTGSGDLSAIGGLIVSLVGAISGSGTVSAGNLQAFLAAVAALTGSGDVTANRSALGALLSALTGSGDIDLTPTAIGELSADLVVTGTGLTTANVGQAVWAKVIEAGFTAEEVLRLIAAVTAGDATGLESGSPAFEGLDESTTRVAGTYSSGTRDITTRNAD